MRKKRRAFVKVIIYDDVHQWGCCCHHCRRCAVAAATPSPVTGSAGGGGTVVVELHLLSLVLNCGTCCSTEGRLHQDRGRPGFSSVNAHTPPHPPSYTPTIIFPTPPPPLPLYRDHPSYLITLFQQTTLHSSSSSKPSSRSTLPVRGGDKKTNWL